MTNLVLTKPKIELQTCVIVVLGALHVVCESYQITHGTMEEFMLNPVCLLNQHKQASMASPTTNIEMA